MKMKVFFDKLYLGSATLFYQELKENLLHKKTQLIVTANPETFMIGDRDQSFERLLLDDRTTLVPDGIGIVKVAHMVGYDVKERIPGVEIAEKLFEYADEYSLSVFLFGAKPEVINAMKQMVTATYANVKLVGAVDGYVKDKDEIFQQIRECTPDIVMVAMGIPAQEKLIYQHLGEFEKGIFIGVGGSFDVLSGMKKRAPKLFIKLNLEWLYRIIKEPSRLKRFYNNNIKFIYEAKHMKK